MVWKKEMKEKIGHIHQMGSIKSVRTFDLDFSVCMCLYVFVVWDSGAHVVGYYKSYDGAS